MAPLGPYVVYVLAIHKYFHLGVSRWSHSATTNRVLWRDGVCKMVIFVYYMDVFKTVDIEASEFLELADRNPLGLFDKIKGVVSDLGRIENVKVYRRFLDPKTFDIVIEYLVRCKVGEVSVKVIHSRNPAKALEKYYEYERKSSRQQGASSFFDNLP